MADAIVVENVEKRFPRTLTGWRALAQPFAPPIMPALRGISFRLLRGESFALIGANGAGKSTLLRILATLLLPTRGRATVAGFDVERQPRDVRGQIGYHSGADPGFYNRLTVRENLLFFAAMNGQFGAEGQRRILDAIGLMGLRKVLERQVHTLSTGMLSRLSLARAVLHSPAVLLLDEPTRSLDPLAATEFRQFLKTELVRARGVTLLFASHALTEVQELADRVGLLDSGRMIACEKIEDLRATSRGQMLEHTLAALLRHADASKQTE